MSNINAIPVILSSLLESLVLGSCYNLVLKLGSHVVEVVRITCYPDEKVLVLVRILLCIEQGVCVNDVELYVMSSEREIRTDEASEFLEVDISLQQGRNESYIEQCSARFRLVEFPERLYHACWSVRVGTVCRGSSVADGEMGMTSVWSGTAYTAEIVVAGS